MAVCSGPGLMDWNARRTLSTGHVKRVAIVGGTHGNEINGVHLAKHFMRTLEEVTRPSFDTEVFIANPGAVEQNTRYVDEDMNRCYLCTELGDESLVATTRERRRAKEVDAILGPKSAPDPRCDLIVDLHNTTAACGIALMMAPDDDFGHELGQYLMTLDKGVVIVEWNKRDDWFVCPSIGRSGMTFEVGPTPWGCLIGDLYDRSRRLLHALCDYVEAHNVLVASGATEKVERTVPVYRAIGIQMDYPRNEEGDLIGMVHPNLQGNDFKEIKEGDPLFMLFNGETIPFRRKDHKVPSEAELPTVNALFVNEAAYYEKKMALMLCTRVETTFSKLSVPAGRGKGGIKQPSKGKGKGNDGRSLGSTGLAESFAVLNAAEDAAQAEVQSKDVAQKLSSHSMSAAMMAATALAGLLVLGLARRALTA